MVSAWTQEGVSIPGAEEGMPPESVEGNWVWLREYLEASIAHHQKLNEQQFKALAEETKTAKTEMDRRLDGMNEIRHQLDVQASTFLSIAEFRRYYEALQARVEQIANERSGYLTIDEYRRYHELLVTRVDLLEKGRAYDLGQKAALVFAASAITAVITGIVVKLV